MLQNQGVRTVTKIEANPLLTSKSQNTDNFELLRIAGFQQMTKTRLTVIMHRYLFIPNIFAIIQSGVLPVFMLMKESQELL